MPRRARGHTPQTLMHARQPIIHVGIDPGLNGGIAALRGTRLELAERMPLTTVGGLRMPDVRELSDLLTELAEKNPTCRIMTAVEKCQARPGGTRAGALLALGIGYGIAVASVPPGWPVELVSPQTWKPATFGRKTDPGERRAVALRIARSLWPAESWTPGKCSRPHDGIIDAALIALWSQNKHYDELARLALQEAKRGGRRA